MILFNCCTISRSVHPWINFLIRQFPETNFPKRIFSRKISSSIMINKSLIIRPKFSGYRTVTEWIHLIINCPRGPRLIERTYPAHNLQSINFFLRGADKISWSLSHLLTAQKKISKEVYYYRIIIPNIFASSIVNMIIELEPNIKFNPFFVIYFVAFGS